MISLMRFSELVKENGFDVFAVTETWLNDRVPNDCLQIPGYNPIIRLDRHQRMGGGVAFFTANSVVVKRRLDFGTCGRGNFCGLNSASNTLIFSVGFVTGRLTMTVFPLIISSSTFNWFLTKFVNFPNNTLLLSLGDFNAHYDVANPSGNSDVGGKLNSFLESNNLAQLIAEPTRVTFNSSTIVRLGYHKLSGAF